MAGARLHLLTGLPGCRWLRWGACAVVCPLLSLGCITPTSRPASSSPPPGTPVLTRGYQSGVPTQLPGSRAASEIHQVAYMPEVLPPAVADDKRPGSESKERLAQQPAEGAVSKGPTAGVIVPGKPVPIDLDAVFRMAEDKNPQIALARARAHEALLERQAVESACMLPGKKIARQIEGDVKIWQRKAELSKTISEILQDAAATYLDFLTAHRAIGITQEMARRAEPMLKRAEDLQKNDPSTKVLYEAVRAEVIGRTQAIAKLKQQEDAATAKLLYLLGLPCDAILAPLDPAALPINLVDGSIPTCKLVEQAVARGPGIQETRGMLAALEAGHARAESRHCFSSQKAQVQHELARNRETQIRLTIQDLAGKLTAGVQEARVAIVMGKEQLDEGFEQVQHASEGYRLSELRVKENAPGANVADVMQSIRGLEGAELGVATALSAYNKAQIRLFLYLGPAQDKSKPPPPPPHH